MQTLTMSTLLGHLVDQLLFSSPFTHSPQGKVYLLRTHPDFSARQHSTALSSLAGEGFITDFKYIDASPKAAVIAIRDLSD